MPFPLLQRYLFGEVLRVFLFVLGCMTVLLMFVGIFQQATERGLDAADTLKLLPYVVPSMLPFTIPAALLLTVCVVYGRISGDQELVAAKAAGISPISLMWPAFFLGAVLSVGSLILTDQVIPWSMAKIEEKLITMMESVFLDQLHNELQFSDARSGLHVMVEAVDGRRLIQPVFRYSRKRQAFTLRASEAIIELDTKQQRINLSARDCLIEAPNNQQVYARERTETIEWKPLSGDPRPRHLPIAVIDEELDKIEYTRRDLAQRAAIDACFCLTSGDFTRIPELQQRRMKTLKSEKNRFHKLKTEVHSRYAMACSCFFFTLLGTPFSMRFGRTQYLTSFLLCFIPIVCCYYPLMLGIISQAKRGHLAPEWSMWVANAAVAVVAILVLRRVIRH